MHPGPAVFRNRQRDSPQAEADLQRLIDPAHLLVAEAAHMLPQAALIQGADLLQQNHGVLAEPGLTAVHRDMCRQPGLARLACARTGGGAQYHRCTVRLLS